MSTRENIRLIARAPFVMGGGGPDNVLIFK